MTTTALLVQATSPHPAVFDVLAAFVAINTLMYVCLALVKMLPRSRWPKALRRSYARSETRSIYPTHRT